MNDQQINAWTQRTVEIAQALEVGVLADRLTHLNDYVQFSRFRMVFLGGKNRGKSSIINHLLQQDILYTGMADSTPSLTYVRSAEETHLRAVFDKRYEDLSPSPDTWQKLLESSPPTRIEVFLDHDWLEHQQLELVDTPPFDLDGTTQVDLLNFVTRSDAVAIVVSITSPFSISEQQLLSHLANNQHLSHLIVLVSFLDMLAPDEAQESLTRLTKKIHAVAEHIHVLPMTDPITKESNIGGLRSTIDSYCLETSRIDGRQQRIAYQVVAILDQLEARAQEFIAVAQIDADQRAKQLKQLKDSTRETLGIWRQIRQSLDKRRMMHGEKLQEWLDNEEKENLKDVLYRLKKAKDVREWWEQDLPYFLDGVSDTLCAKLENILLNAVKQDYLWLQQEVNKRFNMRLSNDPTVDASEFTAVDNIYLSFELSNQERQSLIKQLSAWGGRLGTLLLFLNENAKLTSVYSLVVVTVVDIFGTFYFKRRRDHEKEMIEAEVSHILQRLYGEYANKASDLHRDMYQALADEVQTKQQIWQETQVQAHEAQLQSGDQTYLNKIISDITTLRHDILVSITTA